MDSIIDKAYKIADKNQVILKGYMKISRDVNCLIFAHYCDSTLFYKKFFKISKDVLKVNKTSNKNIRQIKRILKMQHSSFIIYVINYKERMEFLTNSI